MRRRRRGVAPPVLKRTLLNVGMVLFPRLTQLDLTAPHEVLARMPDTRVHLVAASLAPVRGDRGLTISPDTTFDTSPSLDLLCVPGGPERAAARLRAAR
jgi:cyclohexyl-isocyanide hydratase